MRSSATGTADPKGIPRFNPSKEKRAMECAIKSEEIFPSAEIRPLSDAELDHVEGGLLWIVPATLAAIAILHLAARCAD
jgi:hypothetical protein